MPEIYRRVDSLQQCNENGAMLHPKAERDEIVAKHLPVPIEHGRIENIVQ
ncbi:MAG: hypothetical protein ACOYKQ_02405 [Polymorphobacter sp.]